MFQNVSEHPARPRDPERPSVWTSALAEILLGHPDATPSHACQYQRNATVIKPTGLLHYQMPSLCKNLYAPADPDAKRPVEDSC